MSDGMLVVDAEFESRVKRDEPMSRHTSWHVGGPADVYFSPRDRADLLAFLAHAARRHAAVLARARQQPAGARRRHPRRGHRHAERPHAPRTRQRHHAHLRSRRALRAPRAPVHQVGPGPRRIPRRHSRHARRCARDECRRVRRRDLAARAQRRRVRRARRRSPARRARIHVRLPAHRAAGAPASSSSPRRSSSNTGPGSPTRRCASCSRKRKETQPIGEWSCGSTFTNPPGDHAARLIEAAGLKGFRIGDIMVSPKHANFLVNVEAATAADVEKLVAHIQEEVQREVRRRADAGIPHRRGAA